MRRFMMLCVLLGLVAAVASADVSWTLESRFVSDYNWSLGGHTGHPAWQGSFTATSSIGHNQTLYGGLWFSRGAGTFGDEVDLYVGLNGSFTGRDSWMLFGSWYDLNPVGSEGNGDMIELTARYRHAWSRRLSNELGLRWLQPVGHTPPGLPLPYVETRYDLPLGLGWAGSLSEKFGYDPGIYGGDAGWLSRSSLGCSHQLGHLGTIDLTVDLSWPLAGIRDRNSYVSVGAGWSKTF